MFEVGGGGGKGGKVEKGHAIRFLAYVAFLWNSARFHLHESWKLIVTDWLYLVCYIVLFSGYIYWFYFVMFLVAV